MSRDVVPVADHGLDWIGGGEEAEIVLSSRVRVARNLQGFPFPGRAGTEERAEVAERVRAAVGRASSLADGPVWDIHSLDPVDREILVERRLISRDLLAERQGPSSTALALARESSCGVMVNEEDHLRMQSLVAGRARPGKPPARRSTASMTRSGRTCRSRTHHRFGYLTACPTNVGTGLAPRLMLHLPALVLGEEIERRYSAPPDSAPRRPRAVRGGHRGHRQLFQVSNQTTLGKTEEDLIEHLGRVTGKVIEYERSARSVLLRRSPRFWRTRYGGRTASCARRAAWRLRK